VNSWGSRVSELVERRLFENPQITYEEQGELAIELRAVENLLQSWEKIRAKYFGKRETESKSTAP
jgi:hypothetical protein